MMFALLASKEDLSTKDMLIMSMMGYNSPFGNMFGPAQAPAQTDPEKEQGDDIED